MRPPRWGALAYLTKTAVYRVWQLRAAERRAAAHDHDQLNFVAAARGVSDVPADEAAALQMRCDLALELVEQIPERPRRFLLRLALGYSYHEIAALSRAAVVVVGSALGTLVGDMSSTASAAR